MLLQLSIRDIVLIEKLDLDFDQGLSVLTGETGAGKSILLDSLSLALGGRGDGSLVRQGASKGQVTAVFDAPAGHPARDLLRANDIDDDGDLIFRRVQNADGRSRVYINDQPASVALMRQVGQQLVEIHGQHDDRALVDMEAHRILLDAFGGLQPIVATTRDAYQAWRQSEKALKAHKAAIAEAEREGDYLRASVQELEVLHPVDGEEDDLAERRSLMMKAEKIADDINDAQEVLSGHGSPVPVISSLVRRLERKSAENPGLLEPTIEALDVALNALSEAQMAADEAMRNAEFDPADLENTEERLFALRAAARKFNVPVSELPALAARMVQALAELDAGEERLQILMQAEIDAREAFGRSARALSQERTKTAELLREAVKAELPALKLERADFLIEIASDDTKSTADGIDQVEFHVQTNPGTRAGPIMKVASGGELSRFLLALKVALADRGSAPTLVFDEIDTGVGGAVADAIGKRLKRLSENVQVLSVTHAPQVAARASTHFLIAKSATDPDAQQIVTDVNVMDASQRQEEIARMLAGASVTEEARAAAMRLLEETG